ncbi:MAG: hypothetical protein HY820_27890 [Acidobacteria bacterium]|nr:hypothetical protein [Acidobacteriota bacterium]
MLNATSTSPESSEPVKKSGWTKTTAAVALLGAALVCGNAYLFSRTSTLEGQIEDMRSATKAQMAAMQLQNETLVEQNGQQLTALEARISETGTKSAKAASQAMSAAALNARKVSEQMSLKFDEQQKAQLAQHEAVTAQLGELKQDTSQIDTKVTGVATEVTGVKTEVAQTKSDLDRTISDLKSARGDLGVQSGLIATNSKELAALRSLGERDYVEFQLPKTKAPQRIGDVAMQLKKSDTKRNRYTIELIANDKRVEKKDRTINEPVQFYMATARIPYEIVVNEVRNDKIVGYLAAPKVRNPR